MKTAIYTLDAFKESHGSEVWFYGLAKKRNEAFAQKWGAAYRHLKVDPVYDPANYHKLDVFKDFLASDFDRALFLDMDIYIEDACPNLFEPPFPDHGAAMCFDYLMSIFTNYEPWIKDAHGADAKPTKEYLGKTAWNPLSHENNFDEYKGKTPWRYFNTGVILFDRAFAQFMVDNVVQYKLPGSNGDPARFPNGWGEQHEFNYQLDKGGIPIWDMPRSFNEMASFSRNKGDNMTHYAGPHGKILMIQREVHGDQASFQRKYIKTGEGKVLNVGCNTDFAQLRRDFGAINIDLEDTDKVTGLRNAHDILADARDLPSEFDGQCKTVVLGEIMEHFPKKEDREAALNAAKKAIKENGWITITFPQDGRDLLKQRQSDIIEKRVEYAPGVPAYHAFVLTPELLYQDVKDCGLEILVEEDIHYPFDEVKGKGIVAVTPSYRQRLRDNWDQLYDTE